MGDEQHGLVGLTHDAVDAVANHAQRIDVEAAVGLVENRKRGIDDAHLHHLVAFLLAAGESDIHRTLEHIHIHAQCARLLARDFQEFAAGQWSLAAMLALRIQRLAQELDVGNAGDFDRILEAEEQAGSSAFMRFEGQQIFAVEGHRSFGHFIAGPPGQHITERRFARAIGAHNRMDFARVQTERKPLQDRLVGNGCVEVSYLEH